MIISYAIQNEEIKSSNNQANSGYQNWLENYPSDKYTIIEVETNDVKFCNYGNLKVSGDTVVLKTEEDYKQERIAVAAQTKQMQLDACTRYQQGEAKPRIDSNFFSLLTTASGLKKIIPDLEIPCCLANIAWNDTLWSDYEQRKIDADNGDVPNYDYSNNGNPPHTWDECYSELK